MQRTLCNNDNNNTYDDNDIDAERIHIKINRQINKTIYESSLRMMRVKFVLQSETTKSSYSTNTRDKFDH